MEKKNIKYYFKTAVYWPIKKPLSYFHSFFVNSESLERSKIQSYNNQRIPGPNNLFCHAAQKNIYFSNTGRVSACCYNKEYTYGNYSGDNLRELLYSDNRKLLNNSLKNYNLSKGCIHCQNMFDSGNYKAIGSHQYDVLSYNKKYPTMMEFELSNMCNFACIMCSPIYSSKLEILENNQAKPKTIYDEKFVNELKEYIPYLDKAKFFGGEPFLINIYYDIWSKIIEINKDCEIVVQTNASILNNQIKELLDRGNFRLSISIDSLNKDNYQYIRKGADFDSIMRNIDYFIEYSKSKKKPIYFSICPMKQNWRDIPELLEYCNSNKIYLNFNTVNHPHECAIVNMKSEDIMVMLDLYKSHKSYSLSFITKQNKRHFKGLIKQIERWYAIASEIEKGKKYYLREEIKKILLSKATNLKDNDALARFEKVFDTFPDQIELSEFHYNRITNLKRFKVEKVILEEQEHIVKIKLNNLFMLR